MIAISITNRKGGVGKTTTAVNLACALARRGKRTVLCDIDTQRNASIHVGVRHAPPLPSPAFRALAKGEPFEDVVTTHFGFELIAAGRDLAELADLMRRNQASGSKRLLRAAVEEARQSGRWDVVLFDCPPDVGDVAMAALVASDYVLVPLPMQGLPYEGLVEVLELVEKVRAEDNPELRVAGIFSTLIDDTTRLSNVVKGRVDDLCGSHLLATRVRRCNALAEAVEVGAPIYHYKPDSHGTDDYSALAGELIERGVL